MSPANRLRLVTLALAWSAGCVGRIQDAPGTLDPDSSTTVDANTRPDTVLTLDGRTDTGTTTDTGNPPTDTGVDRVTPPTDTGVDVYIPPTDTGSCTPSTEVCNGRDDDCDGMTDEDLGSTTCGTGPCMRTQQNCMGGVPQTCTPGSGGAEMCNGIDDDCDGMVDDGLGSRMFCGGACVDTATDRSNCGACGRACASGQNCSAGTCMTSSGGNVMLDLVNDARRTARMCGTTMYAAVPALTWDTRLEAAATGHSTDMATNNFFSHTGSDGSSASQRITRAGYTWSAAGENIAAGQADEAAAMRSWIASPGHCANIMSPNYTQMGSGVARGGSYGIYWTQNFARPR